MGSTKKPGESVFPGDALAFSEEYLPGEGTFDDGVYLRATRLGQFELDPKEMRCRIKPYTSIPSTLNLGDYVFGKITMIKSSMAGVEVLHVEGANRTVTGDTNGTLHVSKIAKRYVQDVSREYRLGDIVRAKVIDVKPSVQLSTEDPKCGSILALCIKDRFPLKKVGRGLECSNCGHRDTRNLAPDYGQAFVPARVALQVPHT